MSSSSSSSQSISSVSSVSSASSASSSSSELGMTGCLATVTQYKASVPTDTLITDVMISASLMAASQGVRDYLFRNLSLQDYAQWFTLDGMEQNEIFLPEWPVVSVGVVGSPMAMGTLYYRVADSVATNNAFPTYSSDTNGITLNWFLNGVKSTASYGFSSYPTYGDLVAAIQTNTGWTVSWSSTQWAGAPSIFLRPVESQLCVQGVILESVSYVGTTARLIDEFTLELAGCVGRWVFCQWKAGYDLPTTGHRGNLPATISQATVNVARDMLTIAQQNGGLLNGSESLKDYSYTMSLSNAVDVGMLVVRQAYLLDRYRRMGFI